MDAIDPIEAVRSHPGWFFRSGRFEPATACSLLLREAELSPAVDRAQARVQGGWCAVYACGDWLDDDLEPFTTLTFFPEGGINATRVEIVLTAFCDVVVAASRGNIEMCTTGILAMPEAIPDGMAALLADPSFGRVIVFCRGRDEER